MKQAQQFISSLAEQISMPEVYFSIRRLIEKEDADAEDFVSVIETDSVLKLRLMRIANSPYFGFPRRAETLSQAIGQFGFVQLHDLVLSCLVLRTFATVPQQIFNQEAFWRYSIENGIAARALAQYGQLMPINPYFTFGLMHEVGHAAMYIKEPELAVLAFETAQDSERSLVEVEQELLGFDYRQIGVELMQLWQMPKIYEQVVTSHLDSSQADPEFQQTVGVIQLAHEFCQHPDGNGWQQLLKEKVHTDQRLNRLPPNIEDIISSEISDNAAIVMSMLWPNTSGLDAELMEVSLRG